MRKDLFIKDRSIEERVANYNKMASEKGWGKIQEHNNNIYGFWLIGRCYSSDTKFYGAYPPSYLDRVSWLFEDKMQGRVLHLFSGSIRGDGKRVITFDIRKEVFPNVVGDALKVSSYFPSEFFDIILADPPYEGNYEKYGTKPFSKKKVLSECAKILKIGGFLVWLDTIIPQWRKKDGWKFRGIIGLAQSTNHRVRAITILEKVKNGVEG